MSPGVAEAGGQLALQPVELAQRVHWLPAAVGEGQLQIPLLPGLLAAPDACAPSKVLSPSCRTCVAYEALWSFSPLASPRAVPAELRERPLPASRTGEASCCPAGP